MKQKILDLRKKGLSYRAIAKLVGCSKATISYHCGTGQKEKNKQRLALNRTEKCWCGNNKTKRSEMCNECSFLSRRIELLNKTIKDVLVTNKNQHKFYKIRVIARLLIEEYGIKKECKICKFNVAVQVCHIKPISSFDINTRIKVVNDINNLVYLCPNHHVLFDLGLVTL